jgi:hypothetical protein
MPLLDSQWTVSEESVPRGSATKITKTRKRPPEFRGFVFSWQIEIVVDHRRHDESDFHAEGVEDAEDQ